MPPFPVRRLCIRQFNRDFALRVQIEREVHGTKSTCSEQALYAVSSTDDALSIGFFRRFHVCLGISILKRTS